MNYDQIKQIKIELQDIYEDLDEFVFIDEE